MERQVRARKEKEDDQARGTHFLETTERDKSGHRRKQTERGALTPLRPQREGQVRTQKEGN